MKKLLLTTALVMLAAPAYAGLVDWNFGNHTGALGDTQVFGSTSGGLFNLTARGFDGNDVGAGLFSKLGGGLENGLGLSNDPTPGNDEITGKNFVQLNLDGLLSHLHGFEFSMGSTTQGEAWAVYGSEDANPFFFTLLASSSGGDDQGILHTLTGGYDNYNFFYTGGGGAGDGETGGTFNCGEGCNANVLLHDFAATANGVPEPSTWAMGILGFGFVGLMGWRSRNSLAGTVRAKAL